MTDLPAPPPASAIPTDGIAPPVGYAPPGQARPKPPRKWLGRGGGWIIFGAMALLWLVFAYVFQVDFHFGDVAMIAIGAFPVAALFIYTMCYRLRDADAITPQLLVLIFVLGGFAAWVASRTFEPILGGILGAPKPLPIEYQFFAPLIEEICKIVVVVIVARWIPVRNARTGLFVGAAIGFGFAGFENFEKGWTAFADFGHVLGQSAFSYTAAVNGLASNTLLREAFTPVAHPIWTAIAAAALFAGSRGGRLRFSRLFVVAFLGVAIVHTLWDYLSELFDTITPDPSTAIGFSYAEYIVFGLAGVLVWNAVRRRSNRSLALAAQPASASDSLPATTVDLKE